VTADVVRPMVALHLGSFGHVVAGPAAPAEASRERRDRIRSGWLAAGWEWPLDAAGQNPQFASSHQGPLMDLACTAALLIAYMGAPMPRPSARLIGQVGLDGSVIDGVLWMTERWSADGDARVVRRLEDLPDVLAWAAGAVSW
jgi:hypothetical protein